jgi:hypothetical protein
MFCADRYSISTFIRFLSDTQDHSPAREHTSILQPGLCVGVINFLGDGRNLFGRPVNYEILEDRQQIGTVDFTYHNRQYFFRLTDDGYKYLCGK